MISYKEYYLKSKFDKNISCYQHPIALLEADIEATNRVYQSMCKLISTHNTPHIRPVTQDPLLRFSDVKLLDGLQELANSILPQVEEKIFGCYLNIHRIYPYRTLVRETKKRTSFLWHYDDHPNEVFKIMVYLNDVDTGTAPFEYIEINNQPIIIPSKKQSSNSWGDPIYHKSRIPKTVMDKYISDGATIKQVNAPKGTTIVFDNNIIHRATFAKKSERNVIVFQVKPTLTKISPYINLDTIETFKSKKGNLDKSPAL